MKSILAIVAGVVLWGVLWVGNHQVLTAAFADYAAENGAVTGAPYLLWLIAYSFGLSLLAGYVAARIAGRRPVLHAAILGVVQLAIGIAVQTGSWELMPVWFHLSFLALVLPGHLLGGLLRAGGPEPVTARA